MLENDGPRLAQYRQEVAVDGTFKGIAIKSRIRPGGQDPDDQLHHTKNVFTQQLLGNLEARFPNVDLLDAMQVGQLDTHCSINVFTSLSKDIHSTFNLSHFSE